MSFYQNAEDNTRLRRTNSALRQLKSDIGGGRVGMDYDADPSDYVLGLRVGGLGVTLHLLNSQPADTGYWLKAFTIAGDPRSVLYQDCEALRAGVGRLIPA